MLRASISMVFDPFNRFTPQDFVFKIARTQEEIEGFWALRRAIFCEEQKIFRVTDRDEVDATAIPIPPAVRQAIPEREWRCQPAAAARR